MKYNNILLALLAFLYVGCGEKHNHEEHEHAEHNHAEHPSEKNEHYHEAEQDGHEFEGKQTESHVDLVSFTKSQAEKVGLKVEVPMVHPFGPVIKTVAKIEPARREEAIITAKTAGIVFFFNQELVDGRMVKSGEQLFSISSNGLSENNLSVKMAEAKANYESSKANFERESNLIEDKLISEHEYLEAKREFESAKAIYDNFVKNYNSNGQPISSTINGFIKQIYVENGQYVEEGQALASVSQNKNLRLTAQVQQKYTDLLPSIVSANIRTLHNGKTYPLSYLNGKILSFGKSVSNNSFMIPISLQIANKEGFIPGTLTEVYLKTVTNKNAITVPNEALLEDQGLYYIFIQVENEQFEKRNIQIGGTDGLRTEIISGLMQTDKVVTYGAMYIKLAKSTSALDPHSGHVH